MSLHLELLDSDGDVLDGGPHPLADVGNKMFSNQSDFRYTVPMTATTDVLIVQPPLVQLNTAYPAGAYLKSFFSEVKAMRPEWNLGEVRWVDGCNLLFHKIFCGEGLRHIFSRTEKRALRQAASWEKAGRQNEAFNARRYVSQQDGWVRWVDDIVAILRGGRRELCHEFVGSPAVPRGQRMENFLADLGRLPSVDDALILASLALADLADYIGAFFDSSFELVRYGESLAASHKGFGAVESGLRSAVLRDFYAPVVHELMEGYGERTQGSRLLVCVSCPFPGTLAGALFTCKKFKERLGRRAFVVMGGGYVNTELRQVAEPRLALYLDALSYDRGYGSYWDFFRQLESLEAGCGRLAGDGESGRFPGAIKSRPLYKMRFFGGAEAGPGSIRAEGAGSWEAAVQAEDGFTVSLAPDYSDIDFSRYPRLADSANPMHRLWSDGAWLKAYLAHGCYWHQCAFCDTGLDYVCAYRRVAVPALYRKLAQEARRSGVFGVHLVDEAAPPAALRDFALENLKSRRPLVFWGNIRYEKVFSRDLADLLSHGGLRAVSGGIEIASGSGLDAVQKGTDIQGIVSACAAFKEAGVLTHAYMIYGYWLETPRMLIDSMETLRQLFAAGLLDSAFWHKFVLTRHSRVFQEWRRGMHPELKPLDLDSAESDSAEKSVFASNGIRFAGEERSERYGGPLRRALSAWMRGGGLDVPVGRWFPFPMPRPSVSPDLVEGAVAEYERRRNRAHRDYDDFCRNWQNYRWLGGKPLAARSRSGVQLRWMYMGEPFSGNLPPGMREAEAEKLALWLWCLSGKSPVQEKDACERIFSGSEGEKLPAFIQAGMRALYKSVRGRGLCRVR